MARRSIEERISQLEAQRKTLQARLGKQDRAKDTRRKILLGALVLYRLEKSGAEEFSKGLGAWLRRELPGFLTRDDGARGLHVLGSHCGELDRKCQRQPRGLKSTGMTKRERPGAPKLEPRWKTSVL